MAIDTAAKRFSMMDFCGSATGIVMPRPSGTVSAGERLHFLGLYSGFGVTPPPAGTTQGVTWIGGRMMGGFMSR